MTTGLFHYFEQLPQQCLSQQHRSYETRSSSLPLVMSGTGRSPRRELARCMREAGVEVAELDDSASELSTLFDWVDPPLVRYLIAAPHSAPQHPAAHKSARATGWSTGRSS